MFFSVLLALVVLVSFCSMIGEGEEVTAFHDSLLSELRCSVVDENAVVSLTGRLKNEPTVFLDCSDRKDEQGGFDLVPPIHGPDTLSIHSLLTAIRTVESGGNDNCKDGDGGRAIGPFQIHRDYWIDSRVPGDYEDCRDRGYAERVVEAYMKRWCPEAWDSRDAETIARIHNGGPKGHLKTSTKNYAGMVLSLLALNP